MCGIGLQAGEASDPSGGEGKKMIGTARSAVRDAIRTSEAGLARPASSNQLYASTSSAGTQEISPAPPRPVAPARAYPGRSLEF